jgi:putative endonuclease
VAEHRLTAEGLNIVARKVRVPSGEIDLVAFEGDETVCIEVRTRKAVPGLAAESITPQKLERMWRAAFDYAESHAIDAASLRLDLVVVELDAGGLLVNYDHLRALDAPPE